MNFTEISSEALDGIYVAKYKPVEGSSEHGNQDRVY
jgi:hypothetical protein